MSWLHSSRTRRDGRSVIPGGPSQQLQTTLLEENISKGKQNRQRLRGGQDAETKGIKNMNHVAAAPNEHYATNLRGVNAQLSVQSCRSN